ncbi:MAG TPA: S9 family peptidase [Pyrinomonadaceae bacterium]|nr:S9 family peptidase [Pyrinomonadaceae bacterium]
MKRLAVSLSILLIALVAAASHARAQAKPLTINELLKIRRVGDPQLSPDGRWVAYTVSDLNWDANRRVTQIYLISVDGGEPKQLTNAPQSSSTPRWSPDGKRLAFISSREGGPQVWTIDVATGEQKKVTNISTGASDPVWSPDGRMIAFVSDVYPECTNDDCNRKRSDEADSSKVKAKIADRLLFRHWNSWKEGKRTHVFVAAVDGSSPARDMTPGDFDAPPFSLGGPSDYAFSPDSKELVFARNTDKVEATSTNGDLFIVPVTGGEAQRITGKNMGADLSPVYSPDGRFIAYRSQSRAGFESDRWQLMLFDRKSGQSRSLTESLDTSVESITFTPDGQRIYLTGAERGKQLVYTVPTAGGTITRLITDGFNDDVKVSGDGKTIVFSRMTSVLPTEIFRANADGTNVVQLTKTNDLSAYGMRPAEEVTWTGAGGTKVYGYVVKPPDFSQTKKYPMITLIHGGPQGAWNENWGYRWNPYVFASAGYVVFMPNPRGSTGYGQQFTDEISGDWGGKAYTDIMNGVAHVLASGYVDKERIGAAGGSYGGYMVNWIEGHNDDPRFQFKALVSHAGVYNLVSMYGATEELWFTDWEFKGTPWDNPEMYTRWSPNMFVKNFKTPMLVVHGELDYRVPVGEGLQLFTALQRRGVDSKLLYFPDEGHWILKPQNSVLWYTTVMDWFGKYLKPAS